MSYIKFLLFSSLICITATPKLHAMELSEEDLEATIVQEESDDTETIDEYKKKFMEVFSNPHITAFAEPVQDIQNYYRLPSYKTNEIIHFNEIGETSSGDLSNVNQAYLPSPVRFASESELKWIQKNNTKDNQSKKISKRKFIKKQTQVKDNLKETKKKRARNILQRIRKNTSIHKKKEKKQEKENKKDDKGKEKKRKKKEKITKPRKKKKFLDTPYFTKD